MQSKRRGVLIALAILLLSVPITNLAFQGFHDDPGETCLGSDDPFCASEDDGGATHCWACTRGVGDDRFRCKTGSGGTECSEVYDSQGNYHCRITGPLC